MSERAVRDTLGYSRVLPGHSGRLAGGPPGFRSCEAVVPGWCSLDEIRKARDSTSNEPGTCVRACVRARACVCASVCACVRAC
jgi:hypothetical protein